MNKEFAVHMLNEQGKEKAQRIAKAFDDLLNTLAGESIESSLCPPGREFAIVKTKLEEACFFAKKSMATIEANSSEVSNG